MKQLLNWITAIAAIVLLMVILLQNQGSGLGSAFGGETNFYRSKRGLEKGLFYLTIIIGVIFVASVLAGLIVKK